MSGETKRPPSDDLRPATQQGRTDAAGAPAVFGEPSAVSRPGRKSLVREYAEAIVVAMLLAFAIRVFVVQAFKIPSGSMIPTLLIGDHILVNKFLYRFRDPERGDVVVFKYPVDESRDFIKRVIGVGGEDIFIKERQIFISCRPPDPGCRPLNDPWGYYEDRVGSSSETFGPVHVPPGSY